MDEQTSFLDPVSRDSHGEVKRKVSLASQEQRGAPYIGGDTYSPSRDGERLQTQLDAVRHLLSDGKRWWTIEQLARGTKALTGKKASEASISARIRDLRKHEFGRHIIEHKNVGGGLWQYRMLK